MLDPLIQIPGPVFLIVYAGAALLGCIAARWWADADGSLAHPAPRPDELGPVALASLRGGTPAVLRSVIVRLWSRGLLTLDEKKGKLARHGTPTERLQPLEELIWRAADVPVSVHALMRGETLRQAEHRLAGLHEQLEHRHLRRSAADRQRALLAGVTVGVALLAFGGTKLLLGVARGRPVEFLAMLLIAAPLLLFFSLPRGTATRLGRRHLRDVRDHFRWSLDQLREHGPDSSFDPAFTLAVFGIGAVAALPGYSSFRKLFQQGDSGIAGGCGGGCGGGGCGGGGCGGCGG